jgi:hypothetical protein
MFERVHLLALALGLVPLVACTPVGLESRLAKLEDEDVRRQAKSADLGQSLVGRGELAHWVNELASLLAWRCSQQLAITSRRAVARRQRSTDCVPIPQ